MIVKIAEFRNTTAASLTALLQQNETIQVHAERRVFSIVPEVVDGSFVTLQWLQLVLGL